jgi:hypothetical protein
MKITKKYLQRIIKEEASKLLEFEYPNTREQHKKKDAIAAYFRGALDGKLASESDEFWPESFEEVSIDGDESGSAPDAFTITLKPYILTPEEAAKLKHSLKTSTFMRFIKRMFTEKSRLAMNGPRKTQLYALYDAFVLEGSEIRGNNELQLHFKWSKNIAADRRTAAAMDDNFSNSSIGYGLSDLNREKMKAQRSGIDKWTGKAIKPPVDLDK